MMHAGHVLDESMPRFRHSVARLTYKLQVLSLHGHHLPGLAHRDNIMLQAFPMRAPDMLIWTPHVRCLAYWNTMLQALPCMGIPVNSLDNSNDAWYVSRPRVRNVPSHQTGDDTFGYNFACYSA